MSQTKIGNSALPYLILLFMLVVGIPMLNQKAIEQQQQNNIQKIELPIPKV